MAVRYPGATFAGVAQSADYSFSASFSPSRRPVQRNWSQVLAGLYELEDVANAITARRAAAALESERPARVTTDHPEPYELIYLATARCRPADV